MRGLRVRLEAIKSFEAELSSQNVACRFLAHIPCISFGNDGAHAAGICRLPPGRQRAQAPKMRLDVHLHRPLDERARISTGGDYWVKQVRQTVRFGEAVR